MRYPMLVFLAAILACIGVGALGYYFTTLPMTLRVAVGPLGNENVRLISAAVQTLQREREPFRLKLIMTEGSQQSAAALDSGKADLAVVRTDVAYPRNGATVAILHVDHVVLVTPQSTGITTVAGLKGKKVAMVRESSGNTRMLEIVAAQAGLSEKDITVEHLRFGEIRAALEQGRIHAVMAVGVNASRIMFDTVNLVTEVGQGQITFIPVPETSAIEQRNPLIEAETIVRGFYGGPTPRPEEDIATVTVSHQLLASKNLADTTVSDFTRVILNAKAQIAVEAPLAARMEAPDQEKTSPIPIHPGTITYLDGQTTTFLERYGDWFYIAIMGLGLGGSGIAAYFSMAAAKTRRGVLQMLSELEDLIARISDMGDEQTLSATAMEIDALFRKTLQAAMANDIDASAMTAFSMAFAKARDSIAERRRALSESSRT